MIVPIFSDQFYRMHTPKENARGGRMKDIKAIALDLDGTFIKRDGTISERNKQAVLKALNQGIKVVLASGRVPAASVMYHKALGLDTYMICSNGALIYDFVGQKAFKRLAINKENARKILDHFKPLSRNILAHYDDDFFSLYEDEVVKSWSENEKRSPSFIGDYSSLIGDNITKFEIFLNKLDDVYPKEHEKTLPNDIYIINKPGYIEAMFQPSSKWHALKDVLELYGIKPEQTMAFGDNDNDLDMLENVGYGVAMENGIDEAKKAAKYITFHHEEDGVARFLEKNIFS
ncbi:HAD family phosphatase [Anaerobacillus sp. CMMVII]|uniref:Cof-type HAD-IIB family hydrolase n=1 Tax=Anaerobacillus sp. CMMVII TaxID=2755588 RepID=UPI0021B70FAB|nr:Cof-type HAD-IIB family hydrolase [Anaerobacillus sp. CMMVII]MCT8137035.1 HAD family phosphatase [Anaerobacillus sp. CMMVII]